MAKACKNSNCGVSTGIHEGFTFGHGRLTHNGFWEFPCSACAREHENDHPEDGQCWPFKGQDSVELKVAQQENCDQEEKYWLGSF